MKMLVVFLLLLNVSQHALAVLVEVNKEEKSVLLSCEYFGFLPEDLTVMWTRSDLDPKSVHLQKEGIDDLKGQNQRYSGRTSLRPDVLDTGDFSLTLRTPQLTDSGNYTCSISAGILERRLGDIQLQVKDQQMEVKVEEGSEFVILPCKTKPDTPEDIRVEWTRSDRELMMVHVYPNRGEHLNPQDGLYRDRTEMNQDLLRTGDLSLTLKQPTERDTGGYTCTIYRDQDTLRQKVVLRVKEPFPSWAKALLVVLVLLLVFGGLLFHFRQYFMSGYKVEVDSGVVTVLLPCKAILHLPKDTKVEWEDGESRKVHVYQSGSDQPEEQHDFYRGRTVMERNLLKHGDLSLTLKHPTDGDTNIYTCTAYNKRRNVLMEKQVELKVRVPQVQVGSEVKSVQLPFRTTFHLPEDAKVEWKEDSYNKMVHVYQSGSDQPEKRDQVYTNQTIINKDLLKSGDLSLTLKYPTDEDNRTYTCTVYSREGNILLRKQVELKVRVCQVEVEEGAESVQLPFQTTQNLPEDAEVWWWDSSSRRVHVYPNGSDQPQEECQVYRNRTKLNEDLLRTGDLSLTLEQPTESDSGRYRAFLYSRNICKWKNVQIKVKGRVQDQDQTGIIRISSSSTDPTPLMADQSITTNQQQQQQELPAVQDVLC